MHTRRADRLKKAVRLMTPPVIWRAVKRLKRR